MLLFCNDHTHTLSLSDQHTHQQQTRSHPVFRWASVTDAHTDTSITLSGGLSGFIPLWSTNNPARPHTHTHTPGCLDCFMLSDVRAWRFHFLPPFPSLITSASSRFCSDKHSAGLGAPIGLQLPWFYLSVCVCVLLQWEKIKAFMNDEADQKEKGTVWCGSTAFGDFKGYRWCLLDSWLSERVNLTNYSALAPEFTPGDVILERPWDCIFSCTSLQVRRCRPDESDRRVKLNLNHLQPHNIWCGFFFFSAAKQHDEPLFAATNHNHTPLYVSSYTPSHLHALIHDKWTFQATGWLTSSTYLGFLPHNVGLPEPVWIKYATPII